MTTSTNPQIELAYEYVCHTNKNVFLTGKAGTGKTTFLKRIRNSVRKRMAVAAPTGVAAINAGGVTLHSLFQLPFGTLAPDRLRDQLRIRRFSRQKQDLIRSLDLLVIDEISMVRADVLDAIDTVLRRYRDHYLPFGGLQLLMIGDLHQLPPVVKPEEWEELSTYYRTPFFFGSLALAKTDAVTIELTKVYRQSDDQFIALLNKVRDNRIDDEVLRQLNSRFQPDFQPDEAENYITLSSHNATAQKINAERLAGIPGKVFKNRASIDGDFPGHAYPMDVDLEFKVGAQVMFTKNDVQQERRFYNGKIGRITRIADEIIYVRCPEETEDIRVEIAEWRNIRFNLDSKTKQVTEDVLGTFHQYPLKLAWAITIHKSQGLTFEKVIIDAAAAFAHGQVYVALSRCKTFPGIVLRTKIKSTAVRTDETVQAYSDNTEHPTPEQLHRAKKDFQENLLRELFNCKKAKQHLTELERIFLEHQPAFQGDPVGNFRRLQAGIHQKITDVALKFLPRLEQYFVDPALPENHAQLIARLQKAGAYFSTEMESGLLRQLEEFTLLSDNQAVLKKAQEKKLALQKALSILKAGFQSCAEGFVPTSYIDSRTRADLAFSQKSSRSSRKSTLPKDLPHPILYQQLARWRAETADREDVERYTVMPNRSLVEILQVLPTTLKTLKKINGVGKRRLDLYGQDLLEIIQSYCTDKDLPTDLLENSQTEIKKKSKPPKTSTKAISFEMHRAGKTIPEIAKERGLVMGTILSHLGHYVRLGELDIHEVIPKDKVERITKAIKDAGAGGVNQAKHSLGEDCSYGEVRLVSSYLQQAGP